MNPNTEQAPVKEADPVLEHSATWPNSPDADAHAIEQRLLEAHAQSAQSLSEGINAPDSPEEQAGPQEVAKV